MKKNIEEILQNADPATLDGMFDTVKAEKINEKNIRNKVLGENKSNKNPMIWKIIPVAASAAFIVTACALVLPRFVEQNTTDHVTTPSTGDVTSGGAVIKPEGDSSLTALIKLGYFERNRIIWSGDTALAHEPSDVETLTDWNGIKITRELYDRLQTASDDDLFAVTAKLNKDIPDSFDEFVYNGKKCREYLDEYNRTYPIFRALCRLEYCAASNTDAFESWVKDSITEEQGEEFLAKYYHDGVFDKELINKDLVAAQEASSYASAAYQEAYNTNFSVSYVRIYAFETYNGIKTYTGYHAPTGTHYNIMFVTRAQLASLKEDYDKADKTEVDYGFDFDNAYFSLVPYPEEDIKYMQDEETAYVTAIPEDPDQIPETTAY